MARISDTALEDIRSRIDLAEFIGSRITLKRAGGTWKGCCPFHNEKTPSFTVNPQKGVYHCFGCGAHGDVFKFVMGYEGLPFMDAVKRLAELTGVAVEEGTDWDAAARARLLRIHAELTAFYRRCLKTVPSAQIARDYLSSRKLPDDVAEAFSLGYAPKGPDVLLRWAEKHNYAPEDLVSAGLLAPSGGRSGYYDRFQGRLMFPIADGQGRVIAFSARILDKSHPAKYVNSPETDIFKKSQTLYGLHLARAAIVKAARREAIVCEGQIDVIRCHASGFTAAVASQGTAFTKEHVEILKRYADSAVLVFDGDAAGSKAAIRTGALFLEAEIPTRIATLPEGEDPDSLLRDKGPEAFQACLDAAESLPAYQIRILRRIERDPTAVDAVQRIARAVIETIATCPGAVLRAHAVNDAATLLGLPPSALEEDLEAERAALAREQARRDLYARNREETLSALPETPGQDPIPHDDAFEPDFDDPFLPDDLHAPAAPDGAEAPPAPAPSLVGMEAHNRLSLSLCEILVHHFQDPAVMDCVLRHLPADLVTQPYARRTFELACASYLNHAAVFDSGTLLEDPGFQTFITELLSRNSRLEYAREATPLSAIREIITRLWKNSYRQQKERLAADPAATLLRLQLTETIHRLETLPWETVAAYLNARSADRTAVIQPPPSAAKPRKPPPPPAEPKPRPIPAPPPLIPEEDPEPDDDFDLF